MKRSVVSSYESHRYSCCNCGFSPFPAFIIKGDAKFHLDVSEDENVFFLMQVCGALDSTRGSYGGPGTQMKSQYPTNTGSCCAHLSPLPIPLPITFWQQGALDLQTHSIEPTSGLLPFSLESALRSLHGASFLSSSQLKNHLL